MRNYYVMLADEANENFPNNLIEMMLTESPDDPTSNGKYKWKSNLFFSEDALLLPKKLWWIGPVRKINFDAVPAWGGFVLSEKAKNIFCSYEPEGMIASELYCMNKSGRMITHEPYYFVKFSKIADIIDRNQSIFIKYSDDQIESVEKFVVSHAHSYPHVFLDRSLPPRVYACSSDVKKSFEENKMNGIRFLDISRFNTDKYFSRKI